MFCEYSTSKRLDDVAIPLRWTSFKKLLTTKQSFVSLSRFPQRIELIDHQLCSAIPVRICVCNFRYEIAKPVYRKLLDRKKVFAEQSKQLNLLHTYLCAGRNATLLEVVYQGECNL